MSSVAILKYGTYTFDEVPQVGYKQEYKRAGNRVRERFGVRW